jgi:sulfane dehydrogenase subunit SoxC
MPRHTVPDPSAHSTDTSAVSRRDLLAGAAGAIGGAVLAGVPNVLGGQQSAALVPAPVVAPLDATKLQGAPTAALGARSPFETPTRTPVGDTAGSSYTPLQKLSGAITPSDLHFERHHAGIPLLDPSRHTLTIHGLVDQPLTFSVDDIKRFPQVVRTHFVECSGNGRSAYRAPKPEMTAQRVSGMVSTSEWTGVPLATLLREVGVQENAKWILAEGGDACLLARSVPLEKALDDALIVWGQNGEALRPAQGYPLRLLLPGWEGNINVKWLRRLELGTAPWMTRWETSKYTDPQPDRTARIFSFELDAKSIITAPSGPDTIASRGWRPINGIAWSGRGKIAHVDVSVDGGATWHQADLQGTVHSKAAVHFQYMWNWDGAPATLLSRATDDAGFVQPTRQAMVAERGLGTDYHFNHIVGWHVDANGAVTFHGET